MYHTVTKHDGIWIWRKYRKHQIGECFLHFLSISKSPECYPSVIHSLTFTICFVICDRPQENQQKDDDTGTLF